MLKIDKNAGKQHIALERACVIEGVILPIISILVFSSIISKCSSYEAPYIFENSETGEDVDRDSSERHAKVSFGMIDNLRQLSTASISDEKYIILLYYIYALTSININSSNKFISIYIKIIEDYATKQYD